MLRKKCGFMVDDMKKYIIQSTLPLFMEKGFEEISMRELATAANMTTGGLYHYYSNKEEIFYDVVKESALFVHRFSEINNDFKKKSKEALMAEVKDEVINRLSKETEQRLIILLIAYAISKDGKVKNIFRDDYTIITDAITNMICYVYDVKETKYHRMIASILIAAMDGISLQYCLGVIDIHDKEFREVFVHFFTSSLEFYLDNLPKESKSTNSPSSEDVSDE